MDASMKRAFDEDVYSQPFNILRHLGQWSLDTTDGRKRSLFLLYRVVVAIIGCLLVLSGLVDLYQSRTDFKKVVFNVCTTMLIAGIWTKNLHVQFHLRRLNQIRMDLFIDAWSQRENPEYVRIRETFLKIQLYHRKIFYTASFSLLPLWLSTSLTTLVWGPRQLPFSVWTPVDLEDNFQFFCGFVYHTLGSIFIVAETIQADLAMFSLLLQIATQYRILSQNLREIDDMYMHKAEDSTYRKKNINKALLNHQTKEKLRECVKKQLTLMGYVKELETVYSMPMMIQLICGFVLSIGNGLELIVVRILVFNTEMCRHGQQQLIGLYLECFPPKYTQLSFHTVSMNISLKLSYQVGYSLIVLADVFMCCNLADLLYSQGREVVWSLYDIAWYEMDSEVRRYLVLITMGAQKINQLTAAKMFSLNLTTFLSLLKNVYSWLALFRQLVIKK